MTQRDLALAGTLRRLRQRAGLSQEDLAFMSGVPISSVSRYERGETGPGWATVRAIAKALDVSMVELVAMIEGEATEPFVRL